MRELLRLSGAYRCPLRDDKGERVCGLLLPCLRTRLRFPQGESLKFSVSVGTMLSAVGHLRGSFVRIYSRLTKFRIRIRPLFAPDHEKNLSLLGVRRTFSTFVPLILHASTVTVSIVRRPLICKTPWSVYVCVASKGVDDSWHFSPAIHYGPPYVTSFGSLAWSPRGSRDVDYGN